MEKEIIAYPERDILVFPKDAFKETTEGLAITGTMLSQLGIDTDKLKVKTRVQLKQEEVIQKLHDRRTLSDAERIILDSIIFESLKKIKKRLEILEENYKK